MQSTVTFLHPLYPSSSVGARTQHGNRRDIWPDKLELLCPSPHTDLRTRLTTCIRLRISPYILKFSEYRYLTSFVLLIFETVVQEAEAQSISEIVSGRARYEPVQSETKT